MDIGGQWWSCNLWIESNTNSLILLLCCEHQLLIKVALHINYHICITILSKYIECPDMSLQVFSSLIF